MGAVFCTSDIYNAFMTGPDNMIELFHGYTYSAHPIACAAALATLNVYEDEGLMTRAADLEHTGKMRCIRSRDFACDRHPQHRPIGAIELASIPGEPTKRAFSVFLDCYEKGCADPHHG